MKNEAQNKIKNHGGESERRANFASRAFGFRSDFLGDQPAERGEKNSGEQNSQNPEIEMGDPVQSETARGEGPEEFHTAALAEIHEQMENGGGECTGENGKWRNLFLRRTPFAQEKGESDEQAEEQSREQRMKIGAMEGKERGGASKFAQRVDIGDGACDEHGDRGGGRDARKRGPFEGVGGERVGEGIHGEGYLMNGDLEGMRMAGKMERRF